MCSHTKQSNASPLSKPTVLRTYDLLTSESMHAATNYINITTAFHSTHTRATLACPKPNL